MYRQYELHNGNTITHGWVNTAKALKKGQRVTFKDTRDTVWTVVATGSMELKHPPDKSWKVGGLQ